MAKRCRAKGQEQTGRSGRITDDIRTQGQAPGTEAGHAHTSLRLLGLGTNNNSCPLVRFSSFAPPPSSRPHQYGLGIPARKSYPSWIASCLSPMFEGHDFRIHPKQQVRTFRLLISDFPSFSRWQSSDRHSSPADLTSHNTISAQTNTASPTPRASQFSHAVCLLATPNRGTRMSFSLRKFGVVSVRMQALHNETSHQP